MLIFCLHSNEGIKIRQNSKFGGFLYTMLTFTVLSTLLLCISCATPQKDCVYPEKIGSQPDYYWRDFFGVIPKDAVPGGYAKDGNVTYIGQLPSAVHVGIFPGTLHPGKEEATSCQGERVEDSTYVKVLCSNSVNKFEWIKTTSEEAHLLTDYHWVLGGGERKTPSYIGRARLDGEVQIGRVYHEIKGVLIICNKGGGQVSFSSFDLLVLPR